MKTSITPVLMLPLVLCGTAYAARTGAHSSSVTEQVYVYRAKGQEMEAIILRPNKQLLYGHGGRNGTRRTYLAGAYQIDGTKIVLYEFNGHKSLGKGHQTYFPYTLETIDAGSGKIFRRL